MTSLLTSSAHSLGSENSKLIVIPGDPVAWARPRFNHGRAFTAEKQADAKASIGWQLAMGWGRPKIPRDTPVTIVIDFYFRALRKKDIGLLRARKPDVDNLAKLVMDAANGIIYEDDAQVADIRISKRWGETAETKIQILVR